MPAICPDDVNLLPAIIGGLMLVILLLAGITVDAILLSTMGKRHSNWAEKFRRLQSRPWEWSDAIHLLLVMGTVIAAIVLVSQVLDQCGIVFGAATERCLVMGETLFMQGTALITIEYLRRRNNHTLQACFFATPSSLIRDLKRGALYYLAMIPPIMLSALIVNFVLQRFGVSIESQDVLKGFSDSTAPIWFHTYMLGLAVVIAPLVEETVFRGIALPVAAKYASPAVAIIVVSILFALVHAHLPVLVPLFIFAVGCNLAYIHSESLIVPITMHALFNGINLIIFYLTHEITQV